jgi:hypothetical protein
MDKLEQLLAESNAALALSTQDLQLTYKIIDCLQEGVIITDKYS